MQVSTDQLLVKIGRMTVEIDILRAQLSAAADLVCPDTAKHTEEADGGDADG